MRAATISLSRCSPARSCAVLAWARRVVRAWPLRVRSSTSPSVERLSGVSTNRIDRQDPGREGVGSLEPNRSRFEEGHFLRSEPSVPTSGSLSTSSSFALRSCLRADLHRPLRSAGRTALPPPKASPDRPLVLVPEGVPRPLADGDVLQIPQSCGVIATMTSSTRPSYSRCHSRSCVASHPSRWHRPATASFSHSSNSKPPAPHQHLTPKSSCQFASSGLAGADSLTARPTVCSQRGR
jgi:hypothetical protein